MKRLRLSWWILLCLTSVQGLAAGKLQVEAGVESIYFTDEYIQRIRHNRYSLNLKQNVAYSFRLKSVVEGRFRFDAAVYDDEKATWRHLPESIRNDEMIDAEAREINLDYLGDSFRLTAGLQLIQWVESLSPYNNDMMNPIDLRHGAFGDDREVLIPRGAILLNHQLFADLGSLEWLVVPYPAVSRLPKEENGYGLFDFIRRETDGIQTTIDSKGVEYGKDHVEAGLRYLTRFSDFDLSILAFRGHQARPVVEIENINEGESYNATFAFPMTNTFGSTLTWAGDGGLVTRFIAFHEPRRTPPAVILNEEAGDEGRYEKRTRIGIGLDYVFSKHLKLYSEQFATRSEIIPDLPDSSGSGGKKDDGDDGFDDEDSATTESDEDDLEIKNPRDDFITTIRLTNETFENVELVLDAIYATPYKGHIVAPAIRAKFWGSYRMALGGRFIQSFDRRSPFEVLKNSSQVYVSLNKVFSVESEE